MALDFLLFWPYSKAPCQRSTGSCYIQTGEVKGIRRIDTKLKINQIPLSLLHFENSLKGLLSGNVSFIGLLKAPLATIELEAKELSFNDPNFAILPEANALFKLDIGPNEASCSGHIDLPAMLPIDFTASIPIKLSLKPFEFQIAAQSPLKGHLSGSTEITSLLHLLPDPPALSGMAEMHIDVGGSLASPEFSGTCEIKDGTFEILKLGAMVHHLNAHIEGSGTQLNITSITASDDNGGQISGSGGMLLDFSQHCPFQLTLNLEQSSLFNQDYATASFDGQLVLKGDLSAGKLGGSLTARKAEFSIPEQPPSLMNSIDVIYINQPPNEKPPQLQVLSSTSSSWPLSLEIGLNFPSNLNITGRDLSSNWKGDLNIIGTSKTPLINGELKVTEGEYFFNGNPFDINQGIISFAGELEKKTSLYIIAHKDLDQVKVDVILKGPLKNPSISFRSNPPLPQREILSWILFNRGSSEISNFQGSQLSESVTNLDTKNTGPDVLTKIRQTLGIDRLEISRNPDGEENQMGLQVGKYISDNVLVTVNKSDVNSVAIEAALTNRIKLTAEVGDDAEGELLLKWKRDY